MDNGDLEGIEIWKEDGKKIIGYSEVKPEADWTLPTEFYTLLPGVNGGACVAPHPCPVFLFERKECLEVCICVVC